ncbi:hypothetical protein TNCV_162641 [Trichonephila clavipes]|nr:hypothetical protein TNCV_162641 [Trichonephila clavipes]
MNLLRSPFTGVMAGKDNDPMISLIQFTGLVLSDGDRSSRDDLVLAKRNSPVQTILRINTFHDLAVARYSKHSTRKRPRVLWQKMGVQ